MDTEYNTVAVAITNLDMDSRTEMPKYVQVIYNGWEGDNRIWIPAVNCEDLYAEQIAEGNQFFI